MNISHRFIYGIVIAAIVLFPISCDSYSGNAKQIIQGLQVPDGFHMEAYAEHVEGARSLTMSPGGVLYVGTRGEGKVYALVDNNNDFKADHQYVIASGLRMPNGVAFRKGALYVAEVNRILRYDNIDSRLENPPDPVIITDTYPTEGHHGWKYIAFGPDDKLYIPVGAPCNICDPEKDIYASITRINPDGSGREIIARGVRNSVGFAWDPATEDLWFTDNGRDMMGDDRPPGELNHLTDTNQHFGYPYLHGRDIWDPEYGDKGKNLNINFQTPARELDPHVAPLGMLFYTGTMFPEKFRNQIFIAEHGSWNRSQKIGYRITLVNRKNGRPVSYTPFITGWLHDNESVWGRPVSLLQLDDGSVLISDDYGDIIYRLTYKN